MGNPPYNRYATPATSTDAETPREVSGTYGAFRKNGTLKFFLVFLLVLDALLYILNMGVLNYMDMQQYENVSYLTAAEPSELDSIISICALSHGALAIVLIIVFAIWINRSCKNAWLLDPPRMTTTPSSAVAYFFIPIIMLWKPYKAMKEIRSASYGKDHPLKTTLPLWWTFWLITLFVSIYTFSFTYSTDIDQYLTARKLRLIAVPVNVVLNYLAITLVTGITLAQQRRLIHWHQ